MLFRSPPTCSLDQVAGGGGRNTCPAAPSHAGGAHRPFLQPHSWGHSCGRRRGPCRGAAPAEPSWSVEAGREQSCTPTHPTQRRERRHRVSPGSEAAQSPFSLQPPPGSHGVARVCPVAGLPFLTVWIPGDGVLAEAPQSSPRERAHSLGWSWGQNTAVVT